MYGRRLAGMQLVSIQFSKLAAHQTVIYGEAGPELSTSHSKGGSFD